jgi:hypothetical protein
MRARVYKSGDLWAVRLPVATYRDKTRFSDPWGRQLGGEYRCFHSMPAALNWARAIAAIYAVTR